MRRNVACVAGLLGALLVVGCSDSSAQKATTTGATASVRVRWTKSTDPDVVGYRVYRGETPDFPLDDRPFIAVGPNATATIFPDLPRGRHFFKVVAVGTLGPVHGKGGVSEPVLVEARIP